MLRLAAGVAGLALLGTGLYVLTPPALVNEVVLPEPIDDVDAYLEAAESAAGARQPLIPGAEKRITWYDGMQRTPYAVVYLHGFSATRQEIAPAAERIANELGANLFETRLSGHGLQREVLIDVKAKDWLLDTAEALAIGSGIGERLVVIGTSTGATLATAMTGHAAMRSVSALVLISPNFAPANASAQLLTAPAGPLLAKLWYGDTRRWEPYNERQARYWATEYPFDAVVEVMRLVDYTEARLPLRLDHDLLVFLSRDDRVVSVAAIDTALERIDAPRKQVVEIRDPGDPSHHVLAGDILSPGMTETLVSAVVAFVRDRDTGR